MFDLCITQTDVTYPYDGPKLRITPVSQDRLELEYEDTPDGLRHWKRTVDADEVWPCFLDFLDESRWFSREAIIAVDSAASLANL